MLNRVNLLGSANDIRLVRLRTDHLFIHIFLHQFAVHKDPVNDVVKQPVALLLARAAPIRHR